MCWVALESINQELVLAGESKLILINTSPVFSLFLSFLFFLFFLSFSFLGMSSLLRLGAFSGWSLQQLALEQLLRLQWLQYVFFFVSNAVVLLELACCSSLSRS